LTFGSSTKESAPKARHQLIAASIAATRQENVTVEAYNPHLTERLRRMDEEAAIKRVKRAVARPTLIDVKQALCCGTAMGRIPRTQYVPD
jgi:hypothetical protein